jgi:hypothetical protein
MRMEGEGKYCFRRVAGLEKRKYIPESELDSKNEVICLECQLKAGRKSCVALIAAHRQGSFGAKAMRECAVKQDKALQRQTVDRD